MTSRSKGDNQFLSAARRYAERGWPVFPLVPRDKRPLTANGFTDASTDRDQILQWWQLFPTANVGLATGVGFDCLDIDSAEAVPALRAIIGEDYRHAGPVVSTGKGWHFYYLPVEGARNRAGLLGGHIDYRGAGGYVVAPPSVHPSGRVYRWDPERTDAEPLTALPDTLTPYILKPAPKEARPRQAITSNGVVLEHTGLLRGSIIAAVEELGHVVTRKGANHVTHCFFHAERTPSMVLYTDDNSFYCFGCEAHGDSINLREHRDMTGKDFI